MSDNLAFPVSTEAASQGPSSEGSIPFSFTYDGVSISGNYHFVQKYFDNGNGSHYLLIVNSDHVTGVDALGQSYVGKNNVVITDIDTIGSYNTTLVNSLTLVGKGGAPEIGFSSNFHLTLTNGGITAYVDNFRPFGS